MADTKQTTNSKQAEVAPANDSLPWDMSSTAVPTAIATVPAAETAMTEAEFETMLAGDLAEEVEAIGGITLPRVKVPSGGGIAFEVPSGDPDSPDVKKAIVGTAIYHHSFNRYYILGMDESETKNNPPDCYSNDGDVGTPAISGQGYGGSCKECPLNQFGTGKGGVGKACSNRHRLFFLAEGQDFPWVVDVTPTSLKKFREYAGAQLISHRRPMWALVTEISLSKIKGPQADYAEMQFKTVRMLEPQVALAMKAKGQQYIDSGI